jgi:hypothetical protein
MTRGEARQIRSIRDLLRRPFARAALPDVMEDRETAFAGDLGDRIEERIVGGATSGYSLIGSAPIESSPAARITTDSTTANTGRSMKNLENRIVVY